MKIKGFTLIELLITIVIIGVLSTISVATFNNYQEKARFSKATAFATKAEKQMLLKGLHLSKPQSFRVSFTEGSGTSISDQFGAFTFSSVATNRWSTDTPSGKGYSMYYGQPSPGYTTTTDLDNSQIIQNQKLTISAWIKKEASGNQSTITGGFNGYGIRITPNDEPEFFLRFSSTASRITGSDPIKLDTWNHILGTYNGSRMKLYLNGELVADEAETAPILAYTTHYVGGRDNQSGNNTYLIDDAMIFPFEFINE